MYTHRIKSCPTDFLEREMLRMSREQEALCAREARAARAGISTAVDTTGRRRHLVDRIAQLVEELAERDGRAVAPATV